MKNRNRLILIIVMIVAILGIAGYFLFIGLRGPGDQQGSDEDPLFPFGDNVGIEQDNEDIFIDEDLDLDPIIDERPEARRRVFRVTDRPVTAYNVYTEESQIIVERIDEEGESFEETATTVSAIAMFTDTRDGVLVEKNIDNEDAEEVVLTKETVARAKEGYVGGTNGEHIILRFFNDTREVVESFLGTRPQDELPENLCRVGIRNDLTRGDQGSEVEELQRFLNFELIQDMAEDGSFGSGTEEFLRSFQRDSGLEETGITDEATRERIRTRCIEIEREIQERINEPDNVPGVFLRADIRSLVLSPDNQSVFYIVENEDGALGYILNLETRTERQVFSSSFGEWIASWTANEAITVYSAATGYLEGIVYEIDVETEEFRRVGGNTTGITALQSPDGEKVILGEGTTTEMSISLRNSELGLEQDLGLATLPEKCVWTDDSLTIYCAVPQLPTNRAYPDDWYKGLVKFRDEIWRIDASSGSTERIVGALEFVPEVDAIDLRVSDNESYLLLRDRVDYTLWGVDLTIDN